MSKSLLTLWLAAACCVYALPAFAVDWPQSGCDARHTATSPEALPAKLAVQWILNLPQLKAAWPDQLRMDFDAIYRPVIVGQRMILASAADDSVAAYDLNTGRECWRFFAGGPFRLPPASDGRRVFAGSDDGWLYALDADRGSLLWKVKGAPKSRLVLGNGRLTDTWCVRGGPVVADGQVYFAAGIWPFMGIFIHCLDAATGRSVWCNSSEGEEFLVQPHGATSFGGIAPQGTLAVSGQHLLVPGGRTLPASYDRHTGKREFFLLATKAGGHELTANENVFFCAGTAYDLSDGKALGAVPDGLVVDGDQVYGLTSGTVFTTDLAELPGAGAKVKKVKAAMAIPFRGGRTLIKAGRQLYVGGGDFLAAFDLPLQAGQKPVWKVAVEGTVSGLLAGNGHLLAVTDQGRIYGCGEQVKSEVVSYPAPTAAAPTVPSVERAEALLRDSGSRAGFALLLGAEQADLARALVSRSDLHAIVLEPDAGKAQALRLTWQEQGLYGSRLAVVVGDVTSATLPPYFAEMIVDDQASDLPADAEWCSRLFRALHPYHGKAYLHVTGPHRQVLNQFAAGSTAGRAELSDVLGTVRLARSGGVPGAGNWTHEHADAANTRVSPDSLVKAPLGLLWYGGTSHDGILPRHGHGPMPQVLNGHLVIEKVDGLRAVDIYTGRILWEAAVPGLGSYYNNTTHQYGANGTGTNFISMPDAIYVRYRRECLRFDPATGKPLPSFQLPSGVRAPAPSIWGYLNVTPECLIGGVATPDAERGPCTWARYSSVNKGPEPPLAEVPQAIESQTLFVLDRHTGAVRWSATAKGRFRHNAICAGGGRLYAIDRPPAAATAPAAAATSATAAAAAAPAGPARLWAFDLASGKVLWCQEKDVFGTWLSYSAKYDILVEAGNGERDAWRDEARGMRAWRARDGQSLWHDPKVVGPPMLRGDLVLRSQGACRLLDGQPLQISEPMTDSPREWKWTRAYGCNMPAASENLLVFRSGAAGYFDLARFGGTGNWGGFRSSCTNNLLVAGGLVTAPDYTRTCTCSYQNQTSLALCPDPDADVWTYQGYALEPHQPIRRLGINLGAPGNRVDDQGTLWLESPRVTDPAANAVSPGIWPQIQLTPGAAEFRFFRQHSSLVSGPLPWVCASGAVGAQSLRVTLLPHGAPPQLYRVRLYFAEPEETRPGERLFSVALQGREVLAQLDVTGEAGGPRRGLVKQFDGVRVEDDLVVTLKPRGSRPAILSGLEILAAAEEPIHLALPPLASGPRGRAAP